MEHAVIQLISQILLVFKENKFALGIFIDLGIDSRSWYNFEKKQMFMVSKEII